MPAKKQVTREAILEAALNIVKKNGIEAINARSIAKELKCSTQPIYLSFKGMGELSEAIKLKIDSVYDSFVEKHIDIDNYLVSKAKAHILFALKEKKLYMAMFLSNTLNGISIKDIANAEWNQEAVISVNKELKIDMIHAKKIFINMWIFSSGLAIQLATNNMKVNERDIDTLLNEFYERMKIGYAKK